MDFSLKAIFGIDATGVKTEIKALRRDLNSFVQDYAKLGAGLAVGAFVAMSKGAIDLGSKLSDLAIQLGINVERLQVLNAIARDAGVAQDQVAQAIVKTRTTAQEAVGGNQQLAKSYAALGINLKAFLALPAEQRLAAIGKAYAGASDKNAAFNAVVKILGESTGPKMIEVLGTLAKSSFPALEASARKAGDVMSAETIAALDQAGDAIEAFKQRATIAVGNIIVNFRTEEGIKLMGLQLLRAAAGFGGRILDALTEAGSIARAVVGGALGWVIDQFRDGWLASIAVAARALNKVLPDKLSIDVAAIEALKSAGDSVGARIARAISETSPSTFEREFTAFWDSAIAKQQGVVDQLNRMDLAKPADQLRKAGKDMSDAGSRAAGEMAVAADKWGENIRAAVAAAKQIGGIIAGIRGGSVFNELSDAALSELVRQNRAEAARLRNPALTGFGFVGGRPQEFEAARLEAEALNAQQQLDIRNRFRSDVDRLGVEGARRNFDPVVFERLLREFGPGAAQEKTNNLLRDIRDGQKHLATTLAASIQNLPRDT